MLTVREVRTRAVRVPMRRPLPVSIGVIESAPLVLVDLISSEGLTGHAYLFCYKETLAPAVCSLVAAGAAAIAGAPVVPALLAQRLQAAFKLAGFDGLISLALSALDVAAWDLCAKAAALPLATLLGGAPRPVRAYNSNGLGIIGAERAAAEALELLAEGGFEAVKLRLGYATLEEDLAVVRAVRRAIPSQARLMADYNQLLSRDEALARGRAVDGEGLYWIEEPVRHDDFALAAELARELETPIQIGENFRSPREMAEALEARAADYVMPDVQRIFGVTGWLQAAGLAAAHEIKMSSHLFPEISAHLLTVTPTAHYLEYVDWAAPILEQPIAIERGEAIVPDRAGTGITWNEEAVRRYALG